jgi:Mrp family chromosome partitioning ATPase
MIVTFYSYKGGVGRSFTLANVAVVLARWGYRVLVVDWDLDAPGLTHYLHRGEPSHLRGVADLVHEFAGGGIPDWNAAAEPVSDPSWPGQLWLLAAGAPDDGYSERVNSLDWARLYAEKDLGRHLEDVRRAWLDRFDFVLLDSRTGVTDIGGICTAHLPDALVLCFVANRQSLDGAAEVARRAAIARNAMPYGRFRLQVLPLLSRLDSQKEYRAAEEWRATVADAMREFYDPWVPADITALEMVERTAVPYVPI